MFTSLSRKMRRSSENHVDYGILSEHFSPGSKVRSLYIPHHNPAFALETPMKPSQIPNRFPDQTYRRSLHCHRPENHQRHRHPYGMTSCCPPPHSPHSPGPHHHRLGELHHGHTNQCPRVQVSHAPVHQWHPVTPPRLPLPPLHTPVSYVNQTSIHAMFPQRDPPDKSTDAVLRVKRQALTEQDKPRDKVESVPVETVPLVELHKPSGHPLLSGCHKNRAPRPHRESWSSSSSTSAVALSSVTGQGRRSSLPSLHSHTHTQERHQEEMASHTSQMNAHRKRYRSRSDDDHAKKPCLLSVQPDTTSQCLSPNVPTSLSQLPDSEHSLKTSENHTQKTETLQAKPLKSAHCLPHTSKSGVKQASVQFSNNGMIVITPTTKSETKIQEESKKITTTITITPSNRTNVSFSSTPNEPKSLHRISQVAHCKMVDQNYKSAVKANVGSPSCRKLNRPKKTPILDDINDLFTPDPVYTVNSGQKTLKIRPDDKAKILNDKSEQALSNYTQTPESKLLHKEKTSTHGNSSAKVSNTSLLIPDDVQISLPTIILTRMALPVKTEKDANTCESDGHREDKQNTVVHDDCLDLDLDLTLDLDLDAASTQSSDSEEPLVSLQEIMTRNSKPPDTPDKEAFSKTSSPSSPSHTNHKRLHHTLSNTRTCNYKNSLDQILKEMTTSKKAKEMETELLTACQEDLLRIAEFEQEEMNKEQPLSAEHQQILQRYSLLSSAIREVPPGHDLFDLEKFGRIFNQNTLHLRQCTLSPQETAQKTLLWSSHAQFKLYVHIDLFQEAYQHSPCPFQITRFLFKMMCVHSDYMLSVKILQILTDIAYTAATQTVNGSERFRVWVPSVADVTLVLMNMGVPFVSLFPLETLQPSFTEGELLEDIYIKSESPSNQAPSTFPEHNCNNMFKYLSCCLGLCPQAYSDSELLLLLTTLCTVSLETRLLLQATVDLYPLLYKLLNNIRLWDDLMPKTCLALTGLTDDHHNMCYLVQLLPDHTRGKTLRRHLSLCMISKLLDGSCLYRPKSKELQLSDLRLYVWRMKPSSLLRSILSSSHRSHTEVEEDRVLLDQQAYYLCYSLLTLTNEATNIQFFPTQQKKHLLLLCSELERHVKCHIRESEKCLYRSKVKDLVARIYTKWQMLLQKTRPLNGKLYDYWQPPQGDSGGSLDIEEIESSQEVTEKDSVLDQDTVEMVEDGARMDDEVVDLTEKELTQNGLTNAAQEPVNEHLKEETGSQDEGMDYQDGEIDKFLGEGSVMEEMANSTFELDTEGGDTRIQEDELCENMDTETEHTSGLSPEQSLSPGFECGDMERHAVDRTDTALLPLLQTS